MDRNRVCTTTITICTAVALRKESVDRNKWIKAQYPGCRVALRKESVDRNLGSVILSAYVRVSLSARRAWIEILMPLE